MEYLKYSSIFNDTFDQKKAIAKIASEELINILGCILFDYSDTTYKSTIQGELFDDLKSAFSNRERSKIPTTPLNNNFFHPLSIVDILTSISRMKLRQQMPATIGRDKKLLFKLILWHNERLTKKIQNNSSCPPSFLNPLSTYKCESDIGIQAMKALLFGNFLNKWKDENKYETITRYCEQKGINDFNQLLNSVMSGTQFKRDSNDSFCRDLIFSRTPENQAFFDAWKINSDNENPLEFNPLFHLPNGGYIITCFSYFCNKLTDLIYFDLKEISKEIDDTKFLKGAMSTIGEDYFEAVLSKQVLSKTLSGKKIEVAQKNGTEPKNPDFYTKHKNTVYLFECKDKTAGAKRKGLTVDFVEIEKWLIEELYTEYGVIQLTSFIETWRSEQERVLGDFPDYGENLKIVPILFVGDSYFNLPLLNKVLIDHYNDEDAQNMGSNVIPPVIVHVDTFISNAVSFNKTPELLGNCIQEYIKTGAFQTQSFNEFLEQNGHNQDSLPEVNRLIGFSKVLSE